MFWREKKLMVCVGVLFAAGVLAIVEGTAWGVRTQTRRMVDQCGSDEIREIAEEEDWKVLQVLDAACGYVASLSESNRVLRQEIESMTAERDEKPEEPSAESVDETESSGWMPETELLSLFEAEESEGGVYKAENMEDTLIDLVYRSASDQPEHEWEKYDRLEVDMYKRSGSWTSDERESITVTLPEKFGEHNYWVSMWLRTDASRQRFSDTKNALESVNGGTVSLKTGNQTVVSGTFRLNGYTGGEPGKMLCRGSEKITLTMSPQDGTNFFSYAICVLKE